MRIYSMTATFGKLEHETLTLEPGLNIIHAPNEWGKSTWCAFLVTMLYGLDTRERTTKTTLADKERYAPWSGSPMSGRIDLCWQGRNITIERSSKGRTPLGVFRAYETESGLDVAELTATNCGQILLGVERSVFAKAGFLRFSDLPVTNDENLRHRLNALVTTGDDSGEAEALEQKLKDLKNRCRYNRSGLLPQAESHRDALQARLDQFHTLSQQHTLLQERQGTVERRIAELENHLCALEFEAAQEDLRRVETATQTRNQAQTQLEQCRQACENLPTAQQARQNLTALADLGLEQDRLREQERQMPPQPEPPAVPTPFLGMTPEQAVEQAAADAAALPKSPKATLPIQLCVGLVVALVGVALLFVRLPLGIGALCAAVVQLALGFAVRSRQRKAESSAQSLISRYGSENTDEWLALARDYEVRWSDYQCRLEEYRARRADLEQSRQTLEQKLANQPDTAYWQSVLNRWQTLEQAQQELTRAQHLLDNLQAMARIAEAPAQPDSLTTPEAQTRQLLADARLEQRQLQSKLGGCLGQMQTLGSEDAVRRELNSAQQRVGELERTYRALDRALQTLAIAKSELQRRFAPRITQQAQELFRDLTGGRYDRMTLAQDLSVQAGAEGEDTLRSPLYRSDGTADQLYLALRLAVARELTPDAPLVLDDALVRFDDTRLTAAMTILRKEAQSKQVLLFTCQTRELDA